MSVTHIDRTRSIDAALEYLYYGDSQNHPDAPWRKTRAQHKRDGTDRVAYVRSTCGSRQAFACACKAHGRKVQAYTLIQSFSPEEFDWRNPDNLSAANALGMELAQELYPGCEVMVITHCDGRSRAVHNHILVANDWYDFEAGKHRAISRNRKRTQLEAENDKLMTERGQEVLGKRAATWADKRQALKPNSIELTIGDAIARAKARTTDMQGFTAELAAEGVEVYYTPRGIKYKMRFGGRLRRRTASKLADEFKLDQLELYFEAKAEEAAQAAARAAQQQAAQQAAQAKQPQPTKAQANTNEEQVEPVQGEESEQQSSVFDVSREFVGKAIDMLIERKPRGYGIRNVLVAQQLRQNTAQLTDATYRRLKHHADKAHAEMQRKQAAFHAVQDAQALAQNTARLWERVVSNAISADDQFTALVALMLWWYFTSLAQDRAAAELYRARGEMWDAEKASKAADRALADYEKKKWPGADASSKKQEKQRSDFQRWEDGVTAQAEATAELASEATESNERQQAEKDYVLRVEAKPIRVAESKSRSPFEKVKLRCSEIPPVFEIRKYSIHWIVNRKN